MPSPIGRPSTNAKQSQSWEGTVLAEEGARARGARWSTCENKGGWASFAITLVSSGLVCQGHLGELCELAPPDAVTAVVNRVWRFGGDKEDYFSRRWHRQEWSFLLLLVRAVLESRTGPHVGAQLRGSAQLRRSALTPAIQACPISDTRSHSVVNAYIQQGSGKQAKTCVQPAHAPGR